MRCLVCNCQFEGNECPKCKFPVIQVPGNFESGKKTLEPIINDYKSKFEEKVSVGISLFHWKLVDNEVTLDKEEEILFGRLSDMKGRTVFIDRSFKRLSDRKNVEVDMFARVEQEGCENTYKYKVTLPHYIKSENERLSITVYDDNSFVLNVIGDEGELLSSARYTLF